MTRRRVDQLLPRNHLGAQAIANDAAVLLRTRVLSLGKRGLELPCRCSRCLQLLLCGAVVVLPRTSLLVRGFCKVGIQGHRKLAGLSNGQDALRSNAPAPHLSAIDELQLACLPNQPPQVAVFSWVNLARGVLPGLPFLLCHQSPTVGSEQEVQVDLALVVEERSAAIFQAPAAKEASRVEGADRHCGALLDRERRTEILTISLRRSCQQVCLPLIDLLLIGLPLRGIVLVFPHASATAIAAGNLLSGPEACARLAAGGITASLPRGALWLRHNTGAGPLLHQAPPRQPGFPVRGGNEGRSFGFNIGFLGRRRSGWRHGASQLLRLAAPARCLRWRGLGGLWLVLRALSLPLRGCSFTRT
mmetsp:Transcript_43717/g.93008  ORF Transcript_43717/g.93008 Transcript_43717/m.93008 type:complete len:360 (-) Transcript_43717:277-1356(-)